MTFMILLKPHVWEKSGSRLNAKLLSANQIAGFLSFNISKKYWRYKGYILHAATYLLKLQIDDVILHK